jgi:hypothetical protein
MGPDSTGDGTQLVWACTECGREHQKHSPPCSRCGNASLEQREPDYSDLDDMDDTGWLAILDGKYAVGFAVVGVFALVLGLGVAGVVDLPVVGGPPSPPEVPGENETVRGVSLVAVEDAFVAELNAQRESVGTGTVERGPTVDAMATYFNKRVVESDHGDADSPTISELDPFEPNCAGPGDTTVVHNRFPYVGGLVDATADGRWDAEATGTGLVGGREATGGESFGSLIRNDRGVSTIGVDIHVGPEETIYVTAVYC